MSARINHVAVIVAAIVFYAWSTIWFMLWGAQWRAWTGKTPADFGVPAYVVSFVVAIVLAYVVAIALKDSDNPNMPRHGVEFGVFMGVGIWATNLLALTMYESRPLGLWAIDALQVIIGMAIIGAIIGAWRKRA